MDPGASNPNVKKLVNNIAELSKKALKQIKKLAKALVKLLLKAGPIGIIILVILIIIVIIVAYYHMPGQMRSKLLEFFTIDTDKWFNIGSKNDLADDYSDIISVANYLEEMGYNLIGDGFVRPKLRTQSNNINTINEIISRAQNPDNNEYGYKYEIDSDGIYRFHDKDGNIVNITYYDGLGREVDNETGNVVSDDGKMYTDKYGIIRNIEDNKVAKIDAPEQEWGNIEYVFDEENSLKYYRLLRTYLLSNYRIYNLKNSDESMLKKIGALIRAKTGGDQDGWAKGLIKLYNAHNGIATNHWSWGFENLFEMCKIDGKTLVLEKGFANNPMNFSIEGWASRYGMSLEFLLSLHLGTNAPDLVYAMLQNFDTEVQVYIDDSGKAKVNSRYIDPTSEISIANSEEIREKGISLNDIEAILRDDGYVTSAFLVTDKAALEWANSLALSKKVCQSILRSGKINSPPTCLNVGTTYVDEDSLEGTGENSLVSYTDGSGEPVAEWSSIPEELESYSLWHGDDNDPNCLTCMRWVNSVPKDMFNDAWEGPDNWNINTAKNLGYVQEIKNINGSNVENGFEEEKLVTFRGSSEERMCFTVEFIKRRTWMKEMSNGITENDNMVDEIVPGANEEIEYTCLTCKGLVISLKAPYNITPVEDTVKKELENATTFDDYKNIIEKYCKKDGRTYNNGEMSQFEGDSYVNEFIGGQYACVSVRDKTIKELLDSNLIDLDGTPKASSEQRCSEDKNRKRCCAACQKYVKAIVRSLASVSDQDYRSYVPYIARVVGSWFRDTYFVIPDSIGYSDGQDVAIYEYSGNIKTRTIKDDDGNEQPEGEQIATRHPEFNVANSYGKDAVYVQVDTEYLEDTDEYWSRYEMNSSGDDYQLYVLRPDGTTSNTKMEDFLKNGKYIDKYGNEVQATIHGKEVTGYNSKKAAEDDGWAFVKKAVTSSFSLIAGSTSGENNLLWSAYGFDDSGSSTNWIKVTRDDENKWVNELYNTIYSENKTETGEGFDENAEDTGIFYQLESTHNVTQVEDAQRGPTNSLVKYLFKYRQYYLYDGSESKGVTIEHDRKRVMYGYIDYTLAIGYDKEEEYYTNKVLADKYEFSDDIEFELEESCPEDCHNFYHYKGLLGDKSGNTGVLKDYYGEDWEETVIVLLDNYGRSALRNAYLGRTKTDGVEIIDGIQISPDIDKEDLAEQWLEWQLDMFYMDKFGVDLYSYYNTTESDFKAKYGTDILKLKYDPRDPDLIGTVEITKSSLNVFSILENTGTLDADYVYRDFKELIVELDYFDKEELSDKVPEIFTWVIPSKEPVGWPIRRYDKTDVDYGTLIHSKATYSGLDAFNNGQSASTEEDSAEESNTGETEKSIKTIDESKIFWIGDSWIVGLGNSGVANSETGTSSEITSGYFCCKVGENATWSKLNSFTIPADASAIVVEFGLNGTSLYDETQKLITDKLISSNIPIFVLKTSHVGTKYTTIDYNTMNSNIDTYNNKMKEFCDSTNNVTFLDVTQNINEDNGNGVLKDDFTADGLHLNGSDKYQIWYDDIISAINGSAGEFEMVEFEGYEADEYVVSPVTGKILEVGQHDRMNLYTGQMETVDYVVIEAMDKKDYFTEEMFEKDDFGYKTDTKFKEPQDALNLFYDEYEDVCEGYTIMIDGFDVDLSLVDGEGDDAKEGEYKQDEDSIMLLWNSSEQEERKQEEQAKDDAPFFVRYGESKDYPKVSDNYKAEPGLKGYYVKEGKYLGKTIDNSEVLVSNEENASNEATTNQDNTTQDTTENTESTTTEKLTYNYNGYEGPTDYMRIIIKDTDYAIVDNVEDFFEIPEPGSRSKQTSSNPYKQQEGDLELLAALLHNEGCANHFDDILPDESLANDASRATGYVLLNRAILNYGGHGTTIRDQITAGGQYSTKDSVLSDLEKGVTCEVCLKNAEWCLENDCSSVISPTSNKPMPRNVLGQSGWCQCSDDIGKFNCWWWIDTTKDGQKTEYSGGSSFDTFYCINSQFPSK